MVNISTPTREYRDLPSVFTKNPVTNDLPILRNEAAVKASVKNLVLTGFYERPFQPNLGSDVRQLLFENFTGATESRIESAITKVLENYEPRITLISVNVDSDQDRNGFSVTIEFEINNTTQPVEVQLFLERLR